MADSESPGQPLADEAMRLLGAAQEWARHNVPAPGPDGHLGPECQWCPLCQFLSVLRGDRPDVTARVAEAGAALATAFRALVDAAGPKPDAPDEPRVQHIDLDDQE